MNFSSMEYFIVLARERSFTRASEQLHITQQSLSSHIAGLEKELGCQLFVRHIPLKLTYAGKVFWDYATSVQKTLTTLRQEFCDISQNQKGALRVGIAHTRGRAIMPELIVSFQNLFPNISIELSEAANDVLHKNLLNGEIDLAIANFPDILQGVDLRNFYCEEVVMLISKVQFEQLYGVNAGLYKQRFVQGEFTALQRCPFVLGNVSDIGGRIGHALMKRANITHPIVKAKSDNIETLLSLCVHGVGACFCPENLARATLTEEQFSALDLFHLGSEAQYQIRFGYLSQSYQWSIIEAFIEHAYSFS